MAANGLEKGSAMLTQRFSDAVFMAMEAHRGQVRKGTKIPYMSHLLGVASLALEYGADEDQAIAALLHDALEDGGPHLAPMIREQFGARVSAIVEGCTDGVPDAGGIKADWHDRKKRYLSHLETATADVLLVSGADKLHNARSILNDLRTIGPVVFERFSTKRDGTMWYYRSLVEVFEKRDAPIAPALALTVVEIEGRCKED